MVMFAPVARAESAPDDTDVANCETRRSATEDHGSIDLNSGA